MRQAGGYYHTLLLVCDSLSKYNARLPLDRNKFQCDLCQGHTEQELELCYARCQVAEADLTLLLTKY